jgi:enamine deaminase RidA (YjgF/YER057c/UK114 family)
MIIRTLTFTSSHRDDVVGVYSTDQFALFDPQLDDGSYLGGGDVVDAVTVAAAEFAALCAQLGVHVDCRVVGKL